MENIPTDGDVPAVDKSMPLVVNDLVVNDLVGNDLDKEKKACGGTYQCDACGADYVAKTVWQKYCPNCSKERRKQVLTARSRRSM